MINMFCIPIDTVYNKYLKPVMIFFLFLGKLLVCTNEEDFWTVILKQQNDSTGYMLIDLWIFSS